ncbi:hypothetical protein TSAR_010019, partial [Trichomalopsis sarcophagae]
MFAYYWKCMIIDDRYQNLQVFVYTALVLFYGGFIYLVYITMLKQLTRAETLGWINANFSSENFAMVSQALPPNRTITPSITVSTVPDAQVLLVDSIRSHRHPHEVKPVYLVSTAREEKLLYYELTANSKKKLEPTDQVQEPAGPRTGRRGGHTPIGEASPKKQQP